MTAKNQQMTSELSEAKVELEKVTYENKEGLITLDSLKEANQELKADIQELKDALAKLRSEEQQKTGADADAAAVAGLVSAVSTKQTNFLRVGCISITKALTHDGIFRKPMECIKKT